MKLGKIGRLPPQIRQEVNQRLENNEPVGHMLKWLNSLPEVQAILVAHFGGQPLIKQNISEWKKHGYRDWQMRQSALEFARSLDADQAQIPSLQGTLTEKLAHWVALRYAAAAHALTALEDDPETEIRRLREFCGDIVALRRGDLSAGRLTIQKARLTIEQGHNHAEEERRFWEWTNRPEIQAKLYPNRDPEEVRLQVVRMVDRKLLGIRHPNNQLAEPDPAIMI